MGFSGGSVVPPAVATAILLLLGLAAAASAQLSATFYDASCPSALATIKSAVTAAVSKEPRMGASLLRLHFHDCFVQASHLTSLSVSRPLASASVQIQYVVIQIKCDPCICLHKSVLLLLLNFSNVLSPFQINCHGLHDVDHACHVKLTANLHSLAFILYVTLLTPVAGCWRPDRRVSIL